MWKMDSCAAETEKKEMTTLIYMQASLLSAVVWAALTFKDNPALWAAAVFSGCMFLSMVMKHDR